MVDHSLLLAKLELYGCTPSTLAWFKEYLGGRTFRFQVEARRSSLGHTGPYGVPQGSVLGSLLFIISQNDLPAVSPQSDTGLSVVYVDDDTELDSHRDPHQRVTRLQSRADNLAHWLKDNGMVIAPTETKLIIIATPELRAARCRGVNFSIKVGDHITPATQSEKLLGVIVSQDLTWHDHLWVETWRDNKNHPGIIPHLIKRLGLLRHLGRLSSRNKLASFIPAMFTSKVLYALPLIANVWGLSNYVEIEPRKTAFTKNDLFKLQSLQRKAALLLHPPGPDPHLTSTYDALHKVNWLSIHKLTAFYTILMSIEAMRHGRPSFLATALKHKDAGNERVAVPRLRLSLAQEGSINQGSRLVNKLPDHVFNTPSHQLRTVVRSWVLDNIPVKP